MLSLILKALYFFLPAYLANMAPVLLKWIPFLEQPVWERKLGKNKTWRGLVVAVLIGFIVFVLQKYAYQAGFTSWALIDYQNFPIYFGALLGLGALVGDSLKSYYKRKAKIPPGQCWVPWDQLDFVLGAIVFSFFVYVPPASTVLMLIIISPLLHVAANYIGYLLGINKNRF